MNDLEALVKLATEAKERAEKATPGPWPRGDTDDNPTGDSDCVYTDADPARAPIVREMEDEADATFIAHSRADVPTLADGVLGLAQDNQHLVSLLQRKAVPTFGAFGERDGKTEFFARDSAGVAAFMYGTLAGLLEGKGGGTRARNYIKLSGSSASVGRIEVTIQRVGMVTPHAGRMKAEEALARAVALLAEHGIPWSEPTTFEPDAPPDLPEKDDATPWCRIDISERPNVLRCDRCGAEQRLADEHTADVFKAICDAFGAAHTECKEGDKERLAG